MDGYDPIMLEFYIVKEWLKESEENFVILGDFTFEKRKVKGVLLKKSYFLNENPNDIYNICILSKNGDLLPKHTNQSYLYRNIGKYVQDDKSKDKYKMVHDKDLIKALKKKKNIYDLVSFDIKKPFISRELLEMSNIGLFKEKGKKNSESHNLYTHYKKVFKGYEDAFFDAKISEALRDYGDHMYVAMNGYLREGNSFLEDSSKWDYVSVMPAWKLTTPPNTLDHQHEEAIPIVKQKIKEIDRCFLHYAERNEDDTKPFYRGQIGFFTDEHNRRLADVGDKYCVNNFLSISLSKSEAKKFVHKNQNPCCFLTIYVDKGIPMINMATNAKYIGEKEYLLPRDLILTCEKVVENGAGAVFQQTIRVSARDKNQFKVNTNCTDYPVCEIKPSKIKMKDLDKGVVNDNYTGNLIEPDEVIKELKPVSNTKPKKTELDKIHEETDIIYKQITDKIGKKQAMAIFLKILHDTNELYDNNTSEIEKSKYMLYNLKIFLGKNVNGSTDNKPKKICPPGKELYPKTNRCRKIKTPKKEKTPKKNVTSEEKPKKICPPGKELYPKTNRCRKIKTPKSSMKAEVLSNVQPQKLCPPGKELNPKTNRCRKIKTPKKKKVGKYNGVIKDVLNNLVTINGHGSFSNQKIKVPDGFQVLIPHRNGLDKDYTTPDAGKNKLYEEDLYKKRYLNYREGWKLYLPGDDINNLGIHVFHDGASCQTINDYHALQKDLIEKCEGNHSYDKFCPLYCTQFLGNEYKHLTYKGERKLKIKACSDYRLKDLFDNLRNSLNKIPESHRKKISPSKDEPIVLIPFTCNAKSGSRMNHFDHNNKKKLNTIYQELVKNR